MAGQEIFNLERFTYFNDKMRDAAHLLMRKRQYFANEIVNKGLVYLQCITAGITATTELDLTGVAVDDELTDGGARWKVISITGVPIGAGGGMSLKDWKPNTTYEPDNVFVYENEIYKALVKHTSPSAFIELQILEEYTPVDWQPNTLYNIGDIFIESGVLYEVLTSFTSGATFSVTSDINVYTPKTFAAGVDIYIDDIVLYDSAYYKALYDFVCGDIFSLYAFEKYVPHELTEEEINKAIQNFNPAFSGAFGFVLPDSAAAHNAVFRGKNITDYYNSGDMEKAIADGSFKNIFPGDYIVKSITVNGTTYDNVEWVVGDLDYFYTNGDTQCTTHHVLLFPKNVIGTSYMNSTNITTGGYVGSYMWTTRIPQYVSAIQSAFDSSHVLSHRELLTTAISTTAKSAAMNDWTGATNNWAWQTVLVNLFNENMIYGAPVLSSSMSDTGDSNTQIAVMRHHKSYIHTRSNWYWLRSVATSTHFARCISNGDANRSDASNVGGVRPYFLLF